HLAVHVEREGELDALAQPRAWRDAEYSPWRPPRARECGHRASVSPSPSEGVPVSGGRVARCGQGPWQWGGEHSSAFYLRHIRRVGMGRNMWRYPGPFSVTDFLRCDYLTRFNTASDVPPTVGLGLVYLS